MRKDADISTDYDRPNAADDICPTCLDPLPHSPDHCTLIEQWRCALILTHFDHAVAIYHSKLN